MNVFIRHKCTLVLLMTLVFQFSILINTNPTITAAGIQEMHDLSVKCGECPCLNPCSQQQPPPPPPRPPPPPPPPVQYCNPPPPGFIYTAGTTPPPPPGFIYVTGAARDLYPTDDPFNLHIYSNAALEYSLRNLGSFLLVGCSALQLLVLC